MLYLFGKRMANNQILTSGSLNPSSPEDWKQEEKGLNFAQERAVQSQRCQHYHMQTIPSISYDSLCSGNE